MRFEIDGNQDLPFIYAEYTREEISAMNQLEPLKLEVISGIPELEVISTYSHGEFECPGAVGHQASARAPEGYVIRSRSRLRA